MLCLVGRNWLDRAYHYFLILATQECQNKKSRTMGSWINCQKKRHRSVILELRFFLTDMTRRFDWANQSIIVERHRKRIDVTSTAATMLDVVLDGGSQMGDSPISQKFPSDLLTTNWSSVTRYAKLEEGGGDQIWSANTRHSLNFSMFQFSFFFLEFVVSKLYNTLTSSLM